MSRRGHGRGNGHGRGRRLRGPWTLRTRLVVSAVTLIAVVASVIGSVTTIAYRSYLYGKLDDQLHAVAVRAGKPPGGGGPVPGGIPQPHDPLAFVDVRGLPVGAFGAVLAGDGKVTASRVVVESGTGTGTGTGFGAGYESGGRPMTGAQLSALAAAGIAAGDGARGVDLPGLGANRVEAVVDPLGNTLLVGLPAAEVGSALTTLIVVEVCVTAAGLIAAGLAGAAIVGVALRPLRRIAATATLVSELPLHSGEVAPLERVPQAQADPRTEVGQVGAALNRMLDHVGSALAARQRSETRVRQFVADASHELRTPLASIRGYAELTRRGGEETGPDTRHALGRIESEAERMTGMVEDLLLLARLDSGRPLGRERTDLSSLVVDAVSDARAADTGARGPAPVGAGGRTRSGVREPGGAAPAGARTGADTGAPTGARAGARRPGRTGEERFDGHHWRLDLPDEPVTVQGDPTRLHQVLVNLLANARTHTPPGTTVTTRVRPDAGRARVVLEVEDDGPGIPSGLLPHVFERFARGDASRSRGAGSTGLGLAIVQAVVAAHGGRVAVESVPGRTVFAVHLPATEQRPEVEHRPESEQRPGTE
ncbi:sensor histidine kinase [Streptomyces sp. NPDC015144]|uniref:sensor histidine kinase n=1 Tax=Streptomyces sp. NPDC015144 TaxID=3364944 RepID=UPI003700CBEF